MSIRVSDSTPPEGGGPEISWAKKRLPYEETPSPLRGANRGKFFMFTALTIVFAAVAGYMALVQRMPMTDMRVIAPGVGALWFALRIFMMFTPRTKA